jgi:prevent-host-death family protein
MRYFPVMPRRKPRVAVVRETPAASVSLYEAKTQLSRLVDQAAAGETIVISKHGKPRAMLVPVPASTAQRVPAHALRVTYLAPDFDAPDEGIAALFEGVAEEP